MLFLFIYLFMIIDIFCFSHYEKDKKIDLMKACADHHHQIPMTAQNALMNNAGKITLLHEWDMRTHKDHT